MKEFNVLDDVLKEMKELEIQKNKLLLEEEMEWRMKSRVTWDSEGDKNTKFFHNFVAHYKHKNTIWDLMDEEGRRINKFNELVVMGV
jgi:hypothetical protein